MTKALTITGIAIFFVFSLLLLSFAQETVTITTYYPSPYGSYREIRAKRMAIGDDYIQGSQYCWPGETCTNQIYTDLDGDNWFDSGEDLVDLVVQGNVGIGTTGPAGKLDVMAAARTGTHSTGQTLYVTGTLTSGQTGPATGNIEFRHDNATQGIGFGYNTIYQTGTNTNQELNILSRGTSPITLNAYAYSTGNVGIGTTSPGAKLEVAGDGNTILVPRKSTAGDPSGVNGMVYYNTNSNKFRVYESGGWKDLAGGGGSLVCVSRSVSKDQLCDTICSNFGEVCTSVSGADTKCHVACPWVSCGFCRCCKI